MRGVYITGIGIIPVDRHYEKSVVQLALEASREAIESSGESDIDTIVVASSYATLLQKQSMIASLIAEELTSKHVEVFNIENGGASGLSAVHLAVSLIKSGLTNNVLVVGIDKTSEYPQSVVNQIALTQLNYEYHGIMGISLASVFALMANEYLNRYQLGEEDLALWPVTMHENAISTPHAQFKSKITVQNVLQSDYVARPIRVLHTHAQADGASAILLSSTRKEPTLTSVESVATRSGKVEPEFLNDLLLHESVEEVVRNALMIAGVEKKLVGLIEILDYYSIGGPIYLESAGLIPRGETLKGLKDGRFRLGDSLAINLSGGTKGRGYIEGATGVYQVAEISAFLTGYRGYKQHNSDYAIAIGTGGIASVSSCVLIKKV